MSDITSIKLIVAVYFDGDTRLSLPAPGHDDTSIVLQDGVFTCKRGLEEVGVPMQNVAYFKRKPVKVGK